MKQCVNSNGQRKFCIKEIKFFGEATLMPNFEFNWKKSWVEHRLGHLKLDRWTIVDLEYEIEFVCFIGRRFNLKPYIKDIRIDSVLFHHFTWTKAYATQMSENWISRDCHNETANEGKEASGADQLSTRDRSADCSRLFWCHISLMRNRKIYVCTYTERKLKIYQYLDNYFYILA